MLIIPRKKEVITQILSSPLYRRLAKWEAEKIVEQLGEDTFSQIIAGEGHLAEIKIKANKKAYLVDRTMEALPVWIDYMFLVRNSVSPFASAIAAEALGQGCRKKLEADPYSMLLAKGVTFPDADALAESIHWDKQDPKRLRLGADWVLSQIGGKGHTCMPAQELISLIADELEIPISIAEAVLSKKVNTKSWVQKIVSDKQYLASKKSSSVELKTAKAIAALMTAKGKTARGSFIPEKFNEEQRQAVDYSLAYPVSVITGGPGTGKTTVLSCVTDQLKKSVGGSVILAAPTGKAAQRMVESTGVEAQTLHSLLEYNPDTGFRRNKDNPIEAGAIILDEASMVDAFMLDSFLDAVKPGCKIVFVGDHDQLPSIKAGNVLKDMIDCNRIPVTKLEKVYRVAENGEILSAVHKLKSGQMPDLNEHGHDFIWINEKGDQAISKRIESLVKTDIPRHFGIPVANVQILSPQKNTASGVISLNKTIQPIINPATHDSTAPSVSRNGTVYKSGERVMVIKNNKEYGLSNGEIGVIKRINTSKKMYDIEFCDRAITLPFQSLNQMTLAYATTIHKSQGSEYDAVIIPVSNRHSRMLSPQLLYTAATRGKKLVIMVGEKSALSRGLENTRSQMRHTLFKCYLEQEIPEIKIEKDKEFTAEQAPC